MRGPGRAGESRGRRDAPRPIDDCRLARERTCHTREDARSIHEANRSSVRSWRKFVGRKLPCHVVGEVAQIVVVPASLARARARDGMGVARRSSPAAMSGWVLFALCAAFRVVNAFLVRTYFNADEYWQSLEVAHRMVFGYGHLTWEWERGLRGYAHPAMFAALYKLAATLGVDTTPVLVWSPRVLQALVAAAADVHTHRLALRWFGNDREVARWALFCSLACWFNFFCAVRTFSNCTEAALTTAALSYWPWRRRRPADRTDRTRVRVRVRVREASFSPPPPRANTASSPSSSPPRRA